ncbi:hypothetical protein H8959_002901 [Pygathrix nigripes]
MKLSPVSSKGDGKRVTDDLGPRSSPTCNCSLRSLHPSLPASRGLVAIGLHRCPVNSSASVSGVTAGLLALVPPFARLRSHAHVTSYNAAKRRADLRLRPQLLSPRGGGGVGGGLGGLSLDHVPICVATSRPLRTDAGKKGVGPRLRPRHQARGNGEVRLQCMVFPAKRFCLVPSMEGVRWAFSCGTWLPSRAEWLLAVRSIQPEEKERIGQFVFARDAKAAMAGRLMIRKLVAEKLNIPWNHIRLQRTAKGKPVLAKDSSNPYPNFNFNISHQGDYAVLAAEPELQVGIDIMKTSFPGRGSIPEFFHIMKRKFTNKEWETIRSFKDEWTQLDMFYRNWALKESFIKAIGVGLGFELQRLEFDLSPLNLDIGQVYKETRLFLDGEEEKEWAFEESKIDEHHFVAVALRKPDGSRHQDVPSQDDSKPTQRQFTILNFNDLISSAVPMTPEDPSFWDCFCFTEEIPIRNGTKS